MTNAHHPIADRTFLITGGASLIGSHTADRLLAEGAKEVRLFDNFSLGNAATIAHLQDDPRAPLLRGDVADIEFGIARLLAWQRSEPPNHLNTEPSELTQSSIDTLKHAYRRHT